jgi:putative membrane protein
MINRKGIVMRMFGIAGMVIGLALFISFTAFPQNPDISAHKNQLEFPQLAFSGGMMEVQLGKLAQVRASSNQVKEFGDRMVRDHSKANDELRSIAHNNHISLPDNILPEHQKTYDELNKYKGREFDEHYMHTMIQNYKQHIKNFENASKNAKNEEVRQWAKKTLPVLKQRLKLAEKTLDGLNNTR